MSILLDVHFKGVVQLLMKIYHLDVDDAKKNEKLNKVYHHMLHCRSCKCSMKNLDATYMNLLRILYLKSKSNFRNNKSAFRAAVTLKVHPS